MQGFGEDVVHLQEILPPDTPDTEWLEYVGKNGIYVITRDENIRNNPAELAAFREYNVGAFFLGGKKRSYWQLVEQLVRNWQRICEIAESETRPFAYKIRPTGKKFDRLNIGV